MKPQVSLHPQALLRQSTPTRIRPAPTRGDIYWLNISLPEDDVVGHEQRGNAQKGNENGRRPCLVISAKAMYIESGQVCICPLSRQKKGLPFEIEIINPKLEMYGVALANQCKDVDWDARDPVFITKLGTDSPVLIKLTNLRANQYGIN